MSDAQDQPAGRRRPIPYGASSPPRPPIEIRVLAEHDGLFSAFVVALQARALGRGGRLRRPEVLALARELVTGDPAATLAAAEAELAELERERGDDDGQLELL